MKKLLLCCAMLLGAAHMAHASNVGVSVGVNIGGPAPAYVAPPISITAPPLFILPPRLGFYVAAGVGYDMFYAGNTYYLYHGNAWYSSPYYNGPWVVVKYGTVPYEIRRHPFKQIHYYRDNHYRRYFYGRDHYDHKYFKPKLHDNRGGGWDNGGRHDRGKGGDVGRGGHRGGHR